jgi:septal ring factor EnvC (AmiA/AmiB activator)
VANLVFLIRLLFTVCIAIPVVGSTQYQGESKSEEDSRLKVIADQVDLESKRLSELNAIELNRASELAETQKRLDLISEEISQANQAYQELIVNERDLQNSFASAELKYKMLEEQASLRLRALYMASPQKAAESLIVKKFDSREASRMALYLVRLRQADNQLISEINNAKESYYREQLEVKKLIKKKEKLKTNLAKKEKQLKGEKQSKERLLLEINGEKKRKEGVLASLKAQALRLETVVNSLMSSEDLGRTKHVEMAGKKNARSYVKYEGNGLYKARGSLALPVAGKVIRRYGSSTSLAASGFGGIVRARGVTFLSNKELNVVAVNQGQVAFVGEMPALGRVIIIDHGARSFSLYGLLRETNVKKGDIVDRGQDIATLSIPQGIEGNFYFEIRQAGKAVDPAQLFLKMN